MIMQFILLLFLFTSRSYATDNITVPENQGRAYVTDNSNNLWPASVVYTTDGYGDIVTLGGSSPTTDDIIVPENQGKAYLRDNLGRLFPASIVYTTDGAGNVIRVVGGGGPSLTFTSPLSLTGLNVAMSQANSTTNGWLSSADWNFFENKQPLLGYTPLNVAGGTMAGNLSMAGYLINNLQTPLLSTDAATKGYVDSIAVGLIWQPQVGDAQLTDDSLSAPPVGFNPKTVYILSAAGTGAWSAFSAGHAVQYLGGTWYDLYGRAVQPGDRFCVDCEDNTEVPGGSFVGKINNIVQITGGSPGAYTYSFTAPANNYAFFVQINPNNQDSGDSFTYSTSLSQWINFGGATSIQTGNALAYNVTTLNVLYDSNSINTNGSNQLQVIGKEPSITSGTTGQYWRGDKTFVNLDTSVVPENSNLYFTAARAQSAVSATAPIVDTAGVFSIPASTSSTDGYLTASNFTVFNNKQNALTFGTISDSSSDGITVTGGINAIIGSGVSISQQGSSSSTNGYLSSGDWTTFNSKQSAGSYITALTGGVSASGPGIVSATVNSVGGSTASSVNAATVLANAATNINTGSTIVLRDGSGNFLAGTITANLNGATSGGAVTVTGGTAATNGNGGQATISGAAGNGTSTGGNGGQVSVNGGNANGNNTQNNSGGNVSIQAGNSIGSSTGGTINLSSGTGGIGTGTSGATGGTTTINGGTGGAGSSTSGNGGGATLKAGSGGGGVAGGNGGTAQITGGTGGTGSASGGNGGSAVVQGGSPAGFAGSQGGAVSIAAGNGTSTGVGGAGGSVTISTGQANGDNTTNYSGGSLTMSVGKSYGSAGGSNITMTAGTGGVGSGTAGANGGTTTITSGAGGLGSSTGGNGGNLVLNAGVGGNSTSPGTGGYIQFMTAANQSTTEAMRILNSGTVNFDFGIASNITQSTVNGSTSGNCVFSEPFTGTAYKKVMVYCSALVGTATYNFPVSFTHAPVVLTTSGPAASVVTTVTSSSVTITGATTSGNIILEGY